MRKTSWLPLSVLALCGFWLASASAETPNQLSESEARSGWKLLFDGKTTDGWRNYQKDTISDGWSIQDGALTRSGKGAGDIITKDQFENFELSLEYKISPEGNSGLMFHVTEAEKRPWQSGPEIQILDNAKGHDPQQAGWLYQLYKPINPAWAQKAEAAAGLKPSENPDATRPAGQWNQLYLRISPQRCEVIMNGVSYFRFKKGNADWDKKVAASKFSKFPNFGKATKGHICLQDHGDLVSYRSIKVRPLEDGKTPDLTDGPAKAHGVQAFAQLKWDKWSPEDDRGRVKPLRPLVLTHANDGSGRLFTAAQSGVIHVFENDDDVKQARVFLDIRDRIADWKKNNEEGLLGLAFHPNYEKEGELFVYYSSKNEPQTSIVSRFRVSKDDANKADAQEEVIMKLKQPFANHNGGAIAFGPDGYLYIGLGDGGSRNDPFRNGQNLGTLLGSILRIDVNTKTAAKNYGIPADNPFVDHKGAKPEIYAHGFRNIWRLSFDRETGKLWVADVGQDLWEEVNIVERGGNYGWSIREGEHLFGNHAGPGDVEPIDPIWEYDHSVGRSITGGYIYRGNKASSLKGDYVYADYVTGRIWALEYDHKTGKVGKNRSISTGGIPVLAFGEDENGELYYFVAAANGKSIFRLEDK